MIPTNGTFLCSSVANLVYIILLETALERLGFKQTKVRAVGWYSKNQQGVKVNILYFPQAEKLKTNRFDAFPYMCVLSKIKLMIP